MRNKIGAAKSDLNSPFVAGHGRQPLCDRLRGQAGTVCADRCEGEGQFIRLSADMDLCELGKWNPIGDEGANIFQGSLDGMGHTISGLTTSGMMKDAEGNYQFPAAGAIRAYNYYPGDMALSATKQGNTRQITPPTGADSTEAALARDTLFPGTDMDRAVRQSDSL